MNHTLRNRPDFGPGAFVVLMVSPDQAGYFETSALSFLSENPDDLHRALISFSCSIILAATGGTFAAISIGTDFTPRMFP